MTSDSNFWTAIAAVAAIFLQILVGAYFYGGLSMRVKNIADEATEWRAMMRSDFKELKEELRSLRNKLYFTGHIKGREPSDP